MNIYYRQGQHNVIGRIAFGLFAAGVIAFLVFGFQYALSERMYSTVFAILFLSFTAGLPCLQIIKAVINMRPRLEFNDEALLVSGYFPGSKLNWPRALRWDEIGCTEVETDSGDLILLGREHPAKEIGRVNYFREFELAENILRVAGKRLGQPDAKNKQSGSNLSLPFIE